MVLSPPGVPGNFGIPFVGYSWPTQKSPILAWLFFRTGAALHAFWTDFVVRAAWARPISSLASLTSFLGRGLALALHAEAARFSAVWRGLDRMDNSVETHQSRDRHHGSHGC